MKILPRVQIPTPILIFFVIDLALGIAYIFNYLAGGPYIKLTAFLNLDGENNLPTWYSSIQWFCVATLLGIFAFRNFSFSPGRSWLLMALPLIFLTFSLDEVAGIHEFLGKQSDRFLPHGTRRNTLFSQTGIWMFVIGVPFAAIFSVAIFSIRTYFQRAPGALVKMLLGMIIMLIGAIGIETFSNFVATKSGSEILQVFSEEFCEMLGSTIVIWGSYELLHRHGFALELDRAETNLPAPREGNSA